MSRPGGARRLGGQTPAAPQPGQWSSQNRELREVRATDQAIRAAPAVPLRRQPPAVPSTQRDVQNRPNLPGGRVMTAAPQANGEGVGDGR